MGGRGSFLTDSRTLYIGNLPNYGDSTYDSVRKYFGEWGVLEEVKLYLTRGFGFIRYNSRLSAEFAKEAMDGQILDQKGEVLIVKWARDDSNPRGKVRMEKRLRNEFEDTKDRLEAEEKAHLAKTQKTEEEEERAARVEPITERETANTETKKKEPMRSLVGYEDSDDEEAKS